MSIYCKLKDGTNISFISYDEINKYANKLDIIELKHNYTGLTFFPSEILHLVNLQSLNLNVVN